MKNYIITLLLLLSASLGTAIVIAQSGETQALKEHAADIIKIYKQDLEEVESKLNEHNEKLSSTNSNLNSLKQELNSLQNKISKEQQQEQQHKADKNKHSHTASHKYLNTLKERKDVIKVHDIPEYNKTIKKLRQNINYLKSEQLRLQADIKNLESSN